MNETIKVIEFARAVVSGNPVDGNSPDEIAENALELYLSAKKIARKRNEKITDDNLKEAGYL